ncbi:MAG: TldD/PmbA family protein [Methanobacteriaceae archaeon]
MDSINNNNFNDYLVQIKKEADNFKSKEDIEYEIYIEKEEALQLDIQNDSLNFAKEEINFGMGIRIISKQKLGFAYTSNIAINSGDVTEVVKTLNNAFNNSKSNIPDKNFGFAYESNYDNIKNINDSNYDNITVDDAIDFSKSIIATTIDEGCEITSGGFYSSRDENIIINSNNVFVNQISTGFSGMVAVNAEKAGEKSTAYDSISSCLFDLDPVKLATNTCKIAKDSIGGVKIEDGNKNVLLDYHAGSGLLNTFISSLNADNVQRGRSIFTDKIGETVINPKISVFDDGTFEGGFASSKFDGEASPSQLTPLIENGKLNSFIHSIYTAKKSSGNGEILESTGNGMRPSYHSNTITSSSNTIFDFGDKIDIGEFGNGILVTDVLGAHTANPISGDFSVEANNAFLIENGEITKPIKKAMLGGNIFSSLKECIGIKSELKQCGSSIIPKIAFKDLRVVG